MYWPSNTMRPFKSCTNHEADCPGCLLPNAISRSSLFKRCRQLPLLISQNLMPSPTNIFPKYFIFYLKCCKNHKLNTCGVVYSFIVINEISNSYIGNVFPIIHALAIIVKDKPDGRTMLEPVFHRHVPQFAIQLSLVVAEYFPLECCAAVGYKITAIFHKRSLKCYTNSNIILLPIILFAHLPCPVA